MSEPLISVKETIEKLRKEFSNVSEDKLAIALYRALNHTARKGKTEASKQIRNVFNASAAAINDRLSLKYAYKTHLAAEIVASGKPIPLKNFDAKAANANAKGVTKFNKKGVASTRLQRVSKKQSGWGAVRFSIYKGKEERLPGAFINNFRGNVHVMARGIYSKGKGFQFQEPRLPIGILTGISVPLMFSRGKVQEPFRAVVERDFEDRCRHELERLIQQIKD